MSSHVKVISLYSFKGGAGRTVCTANLAGLLAEEVKASPERPLLLMDMDLDSAGLTILLDQYSAFKGSPYNTSRIVSGELSLNRRKYRQEFSQVGMVDVSERVGAPPGTVKFIGAEAIDRVDPSIVYGTAMTQMQEVINYCEEHGIGPIVLDSASGRQESAVLCHSFSNIIIYCCRLTDQFLIGTQNELTHFISRSKDRIPQIILLPVAVPELKEAWKERYIMAMTRLRGLANDVGEKTKVFFFEKGLREVESFKWIESVLKVKSSLNEDEREAITTYQALAKKVTEMGKV